MLSAYRTARGMRILAHSFAAAVMLASSMAHARKPHRLRRLKIGSATVSVPQILSESLSEFTLPLTLGAPPLAEAQTFRSPRPPARQRLPHDRWTPDDIGARIDKGMTAAGEESAHLPPDYAYGAFQRGWFLTAFSLALWSAPRRAMPRRRRCSANFCRAAWA